jgi:hypothetical protein
MLDRWSRFAALTGVAFVALLVASFLVTSSTPSSDASAATVVAFYKTNKNGQNTSAFLGVLATVFLVFFGAILWNRLRAALAGSALPAAGLAGAAIIAVGGASFSALTFALTDVPDKIAPAAVQAINVLSNDFFFPFVVGVAVFLIANGLAIVRSRVLPQWLGWAGIPIGLIGLTPLGIIGFLGSAAWILVASVLMLVRDLRTPSGTAPAPAG